MNGRPRGPRIDEHASREQDGSDEGEAESCFWAFPDDVFPCGPLSTYVRNAR